MAKISSKKRSMRIRINKKRKQKLAKLRQKYSDASGSIEKEKIWEKVERLTPWLKKEEFLAPIAQTKEKD